MAKIVTTAINIRTTFDEEREKKKMKITQRKEKRRKEKKIKTQKLWKLKIACGWEKSKKGRENKIVKTISIER